MQRLKNDLVKTKKLINIARPLELPPLKLTTDSPAIDAKKKVTLPLFGKKRTFGFGKPAAVPAKPAPNANIIDSSRERNVEEFDDDDVGDNKTSDATSKTVAIGEQHNMSLSSSEEPNIITVNRNERKTNLNIPAPVQSSSSVSRKAVPDESVGESSISAHDPDESTAADKPTSKRKRIRYRNRSDKARENIDMDDIEEPLESEKYSKWVPPENQSGDGITDLNSKFGY